MSLFTHIRDAAEGVASVVINQAAGAVGPVLGAIGIGGLLGGGQGGPLPQMGQGSQMSQNQDFGPQTNLENLMNQTGLQQPQISQTASVGGGGLI
jgi:hypothetical protein